MNQLVDSLIKATEKQIAVPEVALRSLIRTRRLIESAPTNLNLVQNADAWAVASHQVSNGKSFNYSKIVLASSPGDIFEIPTPTQHKEQVGRRGFTFIDLFAGIGGFHLALGRAGGHCVFASEWDNSARRTYAFNHGIVPFGDIRDFTRQDHLPKDESALRSMVPYADVIAAGFPCQPFSQAGVSSRNFHGQSHGLECDVQGTLFEDILIIARAVKPKILLLENVSNLARHDSGNTLRTIFSEIEASGYEIFPRRPSPSNTGWAVIDSSSVVGQRRRRVYFACIRKDLVEQFGEFTFPTFPKPQVPHSLRAIIDRDQSMTEAEKLETYSISPRLWESHLKREKQHINRSNGFRIGLVSNLAEPAPTLVARYYKDGKDCLIPNRFDPTLPPRMLTPRECALLQTYPDDFWLPDAKTPAYKQLGNSITVEIAAKISKALAKKYLGNAG